MWKIKLHRLVLEEDFKSLDNSAKRLILKSIHKKLSKDPESFGSPLSGEYKGYWKLKVSYYRVIYRIERDEVVVYVIKVGIRRDDRVCKELLGRLRKI